MKVARHWNRGPEQLQSLCLGDMQISIGQDTEKPAPHIFFDQEIGIGSCLLGTDVHELD